MRKLAAGVSGGGRYTTPGIPRHCHVAPDRGGPLRARILLEEAELTENKKTNKEKGPCGNKDPDLGLLAVPHPDYVIDVFIRKMVKHKKEQSSKSADRPKLPPLRNFLSVYRQWNLLEKMSVV